MKKIKIEVNYTGDKREMKTFKGIYKGDKITLEITVLNMENIRENHLSLVGLKPDRTVIGTITSGIDVISDNVITVDLPKTLFDTKDGNYYFCLVKSDDNGNKAKSAPFILRVEDNIY